MLKIRLQRFGKNKQPLYRIVVIEHARQRQGKPTEVLGFYNPRSKELVYNVQRAEYWKGVGAQASETVAFILSKQPIHDLANGPYQFKSQTRSSKEKAKEEILKTSSKNTKAKKKRAEAEAQKSQEEASV
jgi:small subunit ribosomal protein S16